MFFLFPISCNFEQNEKRNYNFFCTQATGIFKEQPKFQKTLIYSQVSGSLVFKPKNYVKSNVTTHKKNKTKFLKSISRK